MNFKKIILFSLFILAPLSLIYAQGKNITGNWTLVRDESSTLTYFKNINLKISSDHSDITVVQKWGGVHYPKTDSVTVTIGGGVNKIRVKDRIWPFQVFSGVSKIPGSSKEVTAHWIKQGEVLKMEEKYPALVSQGKIWINSVRTFSLSQKGQKLTLQIYKNDDKSNRKTYVFRRGKLKKVYYMTVKNHWKVKGSLNENAFLVSLQGVVNADSAQLYFIYPDDYDYHFTGKMFDFYEDHLGYSFSKISSIKKALKKFKDEIHGYIIWDKNTRTSLNVAFTLAGLKKAVVITSDMLPLVKEQGLKQIADFRDQFTGQTDAEIYTWAYDHYWDQCNKDYIVWMGGTSGARMKPGIADFGILKGSFFTDLSTDPKDTIEYALAKRIMSQMEPLSMVMGWHSYAKDLERNYVTLASHFGLRVEGLNTFPNLSFTSQTPPSPGFEFKNNHNVVPDGKYQAKNKVYITCVQTDGLGLGAWNEEERGSIPYAWEVTINWQWMAPVLLEYYYTNATENDFFFGSLSGPGYMYPKAIPKKLLPEVIQKADGILKKLDLNVFETMDYSEGSTVVGNTELPKYIVDAYYKNMPDIIGFLNGYAPSFTFDSRNGRPFISFDYYLDEDLPVETAVSDLKELIHFNKDKPYFLVLHVREWNSIKRVKNILNQLGSDVEVVPLDVFLKLAGSDPTFKTRYLEK